MSGVTVRNCAAYIVGPHKQIYVNYDNNADLNCEARSADHRSTSTTVISPALEFFETPLRACSLQLVSYPAATKKL